MTLADTAAYMLLIAKMGKRYAASVTTNLNINFLNKARPDIITVKASPMKIGRTQAIFTVTLSTATANDGQAAAVATAAACPSLAVAVERVTVKMA